MPQTVPVKLLPYSVASGALACFASVLGKVAFDGDTPFRVRATASCEETFPDLALCNAVRVPYATTTSLLLTIDDQALGLLDVCVPCCHPSLLYRMLPHRT